MEIGEENVVQVVTDSASALVSVGQKLMDKRKQLFWSPCAAHCLDLILEDIGGITVFYNTIWKAKRITNFIYRHTWVLNLYRTFSKGRELARPAITRFATSFLTMQSILKQKNALRSMFASEKWVNSAYSSRPEAKFAENVVLADKRFWKSIHYCLKIVSPLVKVLRLVDGDSKPTMGYIYEAMDRAKEEIAKSFNHEEKRYKDVWEIIDKRWDLQLHRPLHAATYFLNPNFGEDCKELQTIAIRILSLTCSATGCERNWSVFDQIYSKRRNRLEQQRLNALVFVKYNLQLEIRQKQREEKGDTYDPICLSDLDSDEEWITEQEEPCLMDEESWMDVHECFDTDEGDQSKKRKRGPRNLQDDRNDRGKGKEPQIVEQDIEDESNDSTNGEDKGLDMPILDADSDSDNISLEI
ncbi:uncharacterized protein LOC133302621 [Gastrolobium bilobum]|uniref:uncharacterized protein LOC133302621 n=1 Tax=Gastrolobium bilobum TaxID=150636 RepID=UPI002AB05013|nr:uncharacterized protein LOC133302621 [Gastrolobium bilobum]